MRGVQHPCGEVADVDVLQGQVAGAGGEDGAAAGDAVEPPGQAADVLVGAEDQARAHQQGVVAEGLGRGQFAAALGAGVVDVGSVARGGVHHGSVLVEAGGGGVGVHGAAGHVGVGPGAAGQETGRLPDGGGCAGPGVDDGVPLAVLQGGEAALGAAFPEQFLGAGRRLVPAAVEHRDLPAPLERVLDDGASHELRTTQCQQLHTGHCASRRGRTAVVTLWAQSLGTVRCAVSGNGRVEADGAVRFAARPQVREAPPGAGRHPGRWCATLCCPATLSLMHLRPRRGLGAP